MGNPGSESGGLNPSEQVLKLGKILRQKIDEILPNKEIRPRPLDKPKNKRTENFREEKRKIRKVQNVFA